MNEVLRCTHPTVNPRSVMNPPKKEGPHASRADADFVQRVPADLTTCDAPGLYRARSRLRQKRAGLLLACKGEVPYISTSLPGPRKL